MSIRNRQQIGFHGRYKFYHSLENAPGFINVGLRLFNYYLCVKSFMQTPIFLQRQKKSDNLNYRIAGLEMEYC